MLLWVCKFSQFDCHWFFFFIKPHWCTNWTHFRWRWLVALNRRTAEHRKTAWKQRNVTELLVTGVLLPILCSLFQNPLTWSCFRSLVQTINKWCNTIKGNVFFPSYLKKYFDFIHTSPDLSGKKALNLESFPILNMLPTKMSLFSLGGSLFVEISALNSGER